MLPAILPSLQGGPALHHPLAHPAVGTNVPSSIQSQDAVKSQAVRKWFRNYTVVIFFFKVKQGLQKRILCLLLKGSLELKDHGFSAKLRPNQISYLSTESCRGLKHRDSMSLVSSCYPGRGAYFHIGIVLFLKSR